MISREEFERRAISDKCPDCGEDWIGVPNADDLRKCRTCMTVWEGTGRVVYREPGRRECSMCGARGKPWEFDDSGRCRDCAP